MSFDFSLISTNCNWFYIWFIETNCVHHSCFFKHKLGVLHRNILACFNRQLFNSLAPTNPTIINWRIWYYTSMQFKTIDKFSYVNTLSIFLKRKVSVKILDKEWWTLTSTSQPAHITWSIKFTEELMFANISAGFFVVWMPPDWMRFKKGCQISFFFSRQIEV